MFDTVAIPIWALVLFGLFAALSILERVIGPSVRWFFRKRAERVVARLNTRLQRPIEPFKLARRHDMIQRIKYDPEVAEAIVEYARTEGVREDVAFEMVERYAREIVPSFSATAYFGFGIRASKWLSKLIYRVRVGAVDEARLNEIDPEAAVVFVMNHRSNMDYVLVTWLVSQRSALSYAVGEWARIWPLSALIRTMGAFFISGKSRNMLYRKVLARYVQMATQGASDDNRAMSAQMGRAMESIQNTIESMESRRGSSPSPFAQAEQAIGDLNQLAMMAIEIMMARQLTYFSASEKDADGRCDLEAGMAKLLGARVAWAAADNGLQIHGGNGFALEYPISRVLCDARILNIFEGAAEIQAQVIARRLLEKN